jgi:hypothetical protein
VQANRGGVAEVLARAAVLVVGSTRTVVERWRGGDAEGWSGAAGAQGGEQAAPCGREPRCGMLELVRSRVAGGAGQSVSLGLAAQLGGPGRGQVVADGGVQGGLLVVCGWWCWEDLTMRSASWPMGRSAGGCPGCARVDIGRTDGYSPARGVSPVVGSISARTSATWSAGNPLLEVVIR